MRLTSCIWFGFTHPTAQAAPHVLHTLKTLSKILHAKKKNTGNERRNILSLTVTSQIERTIDRISHDEQLWLIEQFAHYLREESLESDAVEQIAFEIQLADMATDSEIRAELQEIAKHFHPDKSMCWGCLPGCRGGWGEA